MTRRAELIATLRDRAAELRTTASNMLRIARELERVQMRPKRRATSRHVSDSLSWEEFKADATPGCCPCCDKKLPEQVAGRKRVICGEPDCKRLFFAVYRQGRNRRDA